MSFKNRITAIAVALAATAATVAPAATGAPVGVQRPTGTLVLSQGRGQLVNLPAAMSDVFVSNEAVADVQVRSPTQLYVFAKIRGEATIYATAKGGRVVYATNVSVGANSNSLDQMLRLAMPEAQIIATPMNGLVLLTGTVAGPDDGAEAERLVAAFVGEGTQVISRLRTATPLQVNLQVKIAEVSRALVKEIGVNLLTRDQTGGFLVGVAQGRNFGSIGGVPTGSFPTVPASTFFPGATGNVTVNPATGLPIFDPSRVGTLYNLNNLGLGAGKTSVALLGRLFGVDVASALDLAENDGFVSILAQPNLTALSGETASFLAGGEFPIPISQGLGSVSIQYKQYGVSLAFTPIVLADGRISIRVRPEVSELSSDGSVVLNGFTVPAITTRRAETTVELGSGQSFMIGGLLRNTNSNSVSKAPGLGDVPILGAMFRSNSYRRGESELMIVITPYLVKPVSGNQIALPTDGYKGATDAERLFLGQSFSGESGGQRPKPTMTPPVTVAPGQPVAAQPPAQPAPKRGKGSAPAAPGFSQ